MKNKPFCPDFLFIGGPQSGSTWLYVNMNDHSQICLPQEKKELHFFDNNFSKGYDWYRNQYHPKENQITGEVCPSYGILSGEKIEIIREINPNVKLIYLMRDPVEMEISVLNRIANQKESAYKLDDPEEVRKMLFTQYRKGDYENGIKMVDHEKILSHWLNYFDAQSFQICFYEDIKLTPVILLNRIFRFLNINQSICTKSAMIKVNANPRHEASMKWLPEIENYFIHTSEKTKELLLSQFNIKTDHINWLNQKRNG